MMTFTGETLSWTVRDSVVEVELHHEPANEIGSRTLVELETLAEALPALEREARALILYSGLAKGFSAGADLRELYERMQPLDTKERSESVRTFVTRIHEVFNRLDSSSLTTIAAVHGVVFGGGFELALTCDMIVADRMARFCFPELRLGLIPGFGGIPRLRRDLGNAIVRDLLLTGRSVGATRAHGIGLVSQLVGEGAAMTAARATAAQIARFNAATAAVAKKFIKRIPTGELELEIDLFVELFARTEVEDALRRFVESEDPMPYLPSTRGSS